MLKDRVGLTVPTPFPIEPQGGDWAFAPLPNFCTSWRQLISMVESGWCNHAFVLRV